MNVLCDNELILSPIHRVVKRLASHSPSPCTGPNTSSPLPGQPACKRRRISSLSSPDIRRRLLIKQVKERLTGVTVTAFVGSPVSTKDSPVSTKDNKDQSIIEEVDLVTPEESLTLEERHPIIEDTGKDRTDVNINVNIKESAESKKRKIEVKWKPVNRLKRIYRFYIFNEFLGSKTEISCVPSRGNQEVPAIINGRRPLLVVPGLEYGLGEGEGVLGVDTEEELAEVQLANNEKYVVDSFVKDNGYLSEDEMVDTPCGVEMKVKQRRRAGTVQSRIKFDKLGEPAILGCFWQLSGTKGAANKQLKKWKAVIFSASPIQTSYSTAIPEEIVEDLTSSTPFLPSASQIKTGGLVDYSIKYMVKYKVKQVVLKLFTKDDIGTVIPSDLIKKLEELDEKMVNKNRDLVNRYVHKYLSKVKYYRPQ